MTKAAHSKPTSPSLSVDERVRLVEQVGEEIVTRDELVELFNKKPHPVAYDGFEPSGNMHIAQAVLRAININKMTRAGCTFKLLVADWHALANNKMGGDLDKIKTVGKYFIEVWKAAGMDLTNVEFVWASDLVKNDAYWKLVLNIARMNTVTRITRCSQIMGRSEKDALSAAQILYPCMQAADIFYLGADLCQLGMDQRKVNMLAREMGEKLGYYKPVIVSHHMLMGLTAQVPEGADATKRAIAMKMSKSNPASAIFVSDTEDEINKKISKAICPEKETKDNPVLEYCRYIIFERAESLTISRPPKYGGDVVLSSYAELEQKYVSGEIHPADLKGAVARGLNDLVRPIREHFEKDANAKSLLEAVKSFQVTR